jgi:hypothetical protein
MNRTEAFEAGKAAIPAGSNPTLDNPYYHPKQKEPASTSIMMGDNPQGITSAHIQGFPGRFSTTRVYKGKKNVGMLMEDGRGIEHIQTHSDHRREGIANMVDRLANFAAGRSGEGPIKHGTTRTPSGDAWAKKAGGPLPEREASFGISHSLLEDLK